MGMRMGQAGLMAAKGRELGGFGMGTLLADTFNGLVMHWLVRRSERLAQHVGRVMSAVVACLALAVVAVLDAVWESYSVWIGVGVTSAGLFMLATCS
jgi:protein-S-isoprenylcysteine O-methyltransferase Ste14